MEKIFNSLATVQPVAPEKDLWQSILNKKNAAKKIPLAYTRIAAAAMLIFISTELFFIKSHKSEGKSDLSFFVSTTNNILDYE